MGRAGGIPRGAVTHASSEARWWSAWMTMWWNVGNSYMERCFGPWSRW